jgi:tetrahydromethanopterin S-methyltransferase subunit G
VQLRQYVNTEVKSLAGDQSGMDIEALVYLVLMTVADDMENDLKEIMKNVKEINKEKAAQRISKLREQICLFIEQREKARE